MAPDAGEPSLSPVAVTESARATVAAAVTGVILGAAIVATRFVIDEASPTLLALLRYAIGFTLLVPFLRGQHAMRFAWRDVPAIAVLGIGQFALLITLLNYGLVTVPASRAALLFGLFPLFAMVIAALTGREQLSLRKSAGVLLSIAGVALVVAEPGADSGLIVDELDDSGRLVVPTRGELACLAAGLVGAACSVAYGPYVARYTALSVSGFAMLASVVVLGALNLHSELGPALAAISGAGWLGIGFIGVSSAVGFYTWLYALRTLSPTRVTVFISVGPVVAALLGVALLGEALTSSLVAAVGLVMLGLLVALR